MLHKVAKLVAATENIVKREAGIKTDIFIGEELGFIFSIKISDDVVLIHS